MTFLDILFFYFQLLGAVIVLLLASVVAIFLMMVILVAIWALAYLIFRDKNKKPEDTVLGGKD